MRALFAFQMKSWSIMIISRHFWVIFDLINCFNLDSMLNRILDSDLDLDRLKIIVNNCELILLLSYDSKSFRMIQYESKWFTMIQYGPGPYRMVQNDSEWFLIKCWTFECLIGQSSLNRFSLCTCSTFLGIQSFSLIQRLRMILED